jgi:hypothetical protein
LSGFRLIHNVEHLSETAWITQQVNLQNEIEQILTSEPDNLPLRLIHLFLGWHLLLVDISKRQTKQQYRFSSIPSFSSFQHPLIEDVFLEDVSIELSPLEQFPDELRKPSQARAMDSLAQELVVIQQLADRHRGWKKVVPKPNHTRTVSSSVSASLPSEPAPDCKIGASASSAAADALLAAASLSLTFSSSSSSSSASSTTSISSFSASSSSSCSSSSPQPSVVPRLCLSAASSYSASTGLNVDAHSDSLLPTIDLQLSCLPLFHPLPPFVRALALAETAAFSQWIFRTNSFNKDLSGACLTEPSTNLKVSSLVSSSSSASFSPDKNPSHLWHFPQVFFIFILFFLSFFTLIFSPCSASG